jgi:DNA processing protein
MMEKNLLIKSTALTDEQLLFIARCKGVGAYAFRFLLWKFADDFNCILEFLREGRGIALPDANLIKKELEAIKAVGGGVIFSNASDFPEKIHSSCISYIGDRTLLKKPDRLAVIGSRAVSAKGDLLTRRFMETWKDRYIIVSGLAPGVDSIAHSYAKKTIAVIGSGLGHYYPESNRQLRKKIEKEGLVISEQTFWSLPSRHSFPSRNKIIAAISQAVVLMEAGENSGTLNTALHTNAMNKTIFAVPGHPTDPKHLGCNRLIANQEARILLSPDLRLPRQTTLQQKSRILFQEPSSSEKKEICHLLNENKKISDLEHQFSPGKVRVVLALRELGFLS